ncbi:MAG: hypothetical protein J7539_13160 [Niabella sp.]|nr:hypothetical protein [Niabella sp.]
MKKSFLAVVLFAVILVSCSKKDNGNVTPPPPPATGTYQQLLADSLFLYAKQIYYWNISLPDSATFNQRSYVQNDTLTGLQNELFALTRYAKNPDNSNKSYEQAIKYDRYGNPQDDNTECKYSYVEKTSDLYSGGVVSAQPGTLKMTLDGKENQLGFIVGFIPVDSLSGAQKIAYTNKDSSVALVRAVTKGSPAYNAGLRRGQIISKFNGNKWSYTNNQSQISNALAANSITLTLYKPSRDSSWDLNFSKALYTFDPVYKDTVLTINGKTIGYIAFKSFTDLNSNAKASLDNSFGKFGNVTDIVVDLRYNGGGYVETAKYFANLLLPASASGKTLFGEYYNLTMQNGQATLLKNQQVYNADNTPKGTNYFSYDYSIGKNTTLAVKQGSFNSSNSIKNIYFIVSSATASASELLINCLRPYFTNTYLIGAAFSDYGKTTYGKPVGFFEIRLGKYSVFMSNFETKNANQISGTQLGSYYTGIPTDLQAFDDISRDFGDPNEKCFLYTIRKITGNNSYLPAISLSRDAAGFSTGTASVPIPVGRGIGAVTQIHDMIKRTR